MGLRPDAYPRVLSVQQSSSDQLAAATITTTETAFATVYALPANFFAYANKAIRVRAVFDLTTSGSAPTVITRLRLQKAGPTNVNLYAHPAASPANSMTSRSYAIDWTLVGTGVPNAAANIETGVLAELMPGATAAIISNNIVQPVAADTTAVQTIQITITFGAGTAGNTLNLRQLIVEELS